MAKSKAFTLIELLIVIAIIGILAGITMASVTTARNRAYDAQIRTIIGDERIGAEGRYNDNNSYTGYTATRTLPGCSVAAALTCSAGQGTTAQVNIPAGGQDIAIWADLCAATGCWCMDAGGAAKVITVAPTVGTCP